MCGIAFKRKKSFKDYFDNAHKRGTDGIGIYVGNLLYRWYADTLTDFQLQSVGGADARGLFSFSEGEASTTKWDYPWNVSWGDIYQSILDTVLKPFNRNTYALIHHRKTSIGSDCIENVHPFPIYNGRYFLLQNGSSRMVHDWGVINFLSEWRTHSDTYYLTKFIEEKKCDSLESIKDTLWGLIKAGVELGVICVIDTKENNFLLLSDGKRSLYIDANIDDSYVREFSSLTEDGSDKYSFRWYMILDFNWTIHSIEYSYINKEEEKKSTQVCTTYSAGSPYSSSYYYDEDRYSSYYKKKETKEDESEQLALAQIEGIFSWDITEETELWEWTPPMNYVDPSMIIDSADLNDYLSQFFEIEKDLCDRRDSWMGQWAVYANLIAQLKELANLIAIEMDELLDDFIVTYCNDWGGSDVDSYYEYVDSEKMQIMDMVFQFDENFEFEDNY